MSLLPCVELLERSSSPVVYTSSSLLLSHTHSNAGPLCGALETAVVLATSNLHDAESTVRAQASPAFLGSVGHSGSPPPSFSRFPDLTQWWVRADLVGRYLPSS